MKNSALITLTTDFGTRDWYVGSLKGVILAINPKARLVDLTHEIPAGDIQAGALALAACRRFFPKGTIHLAVVDPGVGSSRRALAIQTERFYFIGPDNGVLSWAAGKEKIVAVQALENPTFMCHPVSSTFHGRDVFAPAAAHLSLGVPLGRLGPALAEFVRLPWPQSTRWGRQLAGEIVYIDRFGNALTSIDGSALEKMGEGILEMVCQGRRLGPIVQFYQAVPAGAPLALVGSSGFLEIAINGGNAARKLGLRIGTKVSVRMVK